MGVTASGAGGASAAAVDRGAEAASVAAGSVGVDSAGSVGRRSFPGDKEARDGISGTVLGGLVASSGLRRAPAALGLAPRRRHPVGRPRHDRSWYDVAVDAGQRALLRRPPTPDRRRPVHPELQVRGLEERRLARPDRAPVPRCRRHGGEPSVAGLPHAPWMLAIVLLAVGVMRVVVGVQHRGTSGWGGAVLGGIITLFLGL